MQSSFRTVTALAVTLLVGSTLAAQPLPAPIPEDAVSDARELAFSGQRDDAFRLLEAHLDGDPDDTEARTLYGTVLSWEGRYDEARAQLQSVLDRNPTHGDALPALANVELWSDHPERAESLTAHGLITHPASSSLYITRARALWNLSREKDALEAVDRALVVDAGNETALRLRRALRDTQRYWRANIAFGFDGFSDDRAAWAETRYSMTRQTRLGSVTGRLYRAERFGTADHQVEIDAYPRFREGTYAYVSGAFAPTPSLFPEYRFAGDVYQSLGAGFEASVGYRRMQFTDAVNIYVGSLTKYRGSWMLTGRMFLTPGLLGTSKSIHGIARRYWSDGVGYVGVRYGRGAYRDEVRSRNDIQLLSSDSFGAELMMPIGTLELWVSTSASREGRAGRNDLWQFSTSSGLSVRF